MWLFLPTAPSGDLPLERLGALPFEQEWGTAGRNRSVDGQPLRIGGRTFATGYGTHARSRLDLKVSRNALRFRAVAGVDDEAHDNATVRFLVLADGKARYDSGVLRRGTAAAVDADVSDANIVSLVVEDGGDGIDNDHADWAEPVLTLRDPAKRPVILSAALEPTMPIAPVDLVRTAIHGPRVVGGTPGRELLFRVPATGKGPLRFEYRNLPPGIRADGNLLRGIVPPAGKYVITVQVSGPRGRATRELTVVSGDRKLALTPPMGWNSWNVWGTSVTADKVRAAAQAFVKLGLADFGYAYVNIDDGWEAGRDEAGNILPNQKFGNLPKMAGDVHALGLKLGIYSSPGPLTCGGFEGSYQHEAQDAASYAKWGVDYLKYDWCTYGRISAGKTLEEQQAPYRKMREALDASGRDIVYSLCQYGMGDVWKWGPDVGGNLWRTTGDITDSWSSMSSIGFGHSDRGSRIGPGAWNDPDMLVVGKLGWGPSLRPTRLLGNEQITHITLWSMLAAPLLIGCDLSQMDEFTKRLLLNDDVIAVDQDPLGKAATQVRRVSDTEVWARPLADGSTAVALFNRGLERTSVAVDWKRDLGLAAPQRVRDLWLRRELGKKTTGYAATVPAHGAVLITVRP